MFSIEIYYNTCSLFASKSSSSSASATTLKSLMATTLTTMITRMSKSTPATTAKTTRQISSVMTSVLTSITVSFLVFLIIPNGRSYGVTAITQSSLASSSSLGVHIIRSPESAVAPKGDEVIFECELNLSPEQLKWRFRHASKRTIDGSNFDFLPTKEGFNVTSEERTSKLHVVVQPETLGDYQCVAWFGSAAIASTIATLTLVSISIDNSNGYSRSAIRWNVAPKNCVLIRCGTVTSYPSPIWSFYRNGEKIPQTDIISTANGALVLNTVSAKDSGNYSCSAMNPITAEEVQMPQRIDLRVDYSDRTPPYFLQQPSTQVTARPGETVALECPGVGSPPPIAVWSSPNVMNINNNRTRMLPYGLQITDVILEDQGSYVCRLDNGIAPALVHIIKLTVYEKPTILRGPARTSANESDTLELECSVKGNPYPDIYWLINGVDTSRDGDLLHDGRRLVIQHVQKRHAGIVQCFAKNVVGEISEANRLTVNPKQIHGNSNAGINGSTQRSNHEHSGGKSKGKKKHRTATMVPPSRPNVTRLSDDSVMLRWYVSKNDGLPIQFFKVQYRMLGGSSHKIPRENWQTTNDDIPFGKRNRNAEMLKNFTSSVTGLKPDRFYKFRIIAVYSNNDNREGNTSAKFFLRKGNALELAKSNLPTPTLNRVESLSPSAVMLHWSLPSYTASAEDKVHGFYAYYRPTTSAEEYLKATVDGVDARKFKIDALEAGTSYEFKLQSFNELAASEFSAIVKGMTKKLPNTTPTLSEVIVPSTKTSEEYTSIYPVIAGAVGGGVLLLIASIAACLCLKKRKNSTAEEENKPQLDHIQADFVTTPQVLGISSHHHHQQKNGHRLNGVLPRMNITPNPLAQEADKNRNVMELRFMANKSSSNSNISNSDSNNISSGLISKVCNGGNATLKNLSIASSAESIENTRGQSGEVPNVPSAQRVSSSSCETLQAGEGCILQSTDQSPLSKPLPPLPGKSNNNNNNTMLQQQQQQQHTTPQAIKTLLSTSSSSSATASSSSSSSPTQSQSSTMTTTSTTNLVNNYFHTSQGQGLGGGGIGTMHHAQPYYQSPGTPSALMQKKTDYQQQPPPVPPHQNNNHHQQHHHLPPHPSHPSHQAPLTPMLEQQRRTLDRNARNLPPYTINDNAALEGMPTRIPSLRRTRRTSGGNSGGGGAAVISNNVNGSLGIPISGSPRVQRSPMPGRAALIKQRSRLGSHNDNISSGSLNSIEV